MEREKALEQYHKLLQQCAEEHAAVLGLAAHEVIKVTVLVSVEKRWPVTVEVQVEEGDQRAQDLPPEHWDIMCQKAEGRFARYRPIIEMLRRNHNVPVPLQQFNEVFLRVHRRSFTLNTVRDINDYLRWLKRQGHLPHTYRLRKSPNSQEKGAHGRYSIL